MFRRTHNIEKCIFPPDMNPELGMQLEASSEKESPGVFTIADIAKETITLDGNHPFAEKNHF
jgi:FKBP-type peptidyl-prolyl cis-trans isomerase 2